MKCVSGALSRAGTLERVWLRRRLLATSSIMARVRIRRFPGDVVTPRRESRQILVVWNPP